MLGRLQDRRAWLAVSGSGKPCSPAVRRRGHRGESCDDGNTVSDDGCSATCKLEIGYKCTGSSGQKSVCTHTVCGDGNVEGAEGCDDGNTVPFDGCSEDCQIEPNCSGTSGCTSKCGDGIVLNEACDDGNQANGDGCSKTCQVEPGWTCTQPTLGNTMQVPVIYRDFRFYNPRISRADQRFIRSLPGMVNATLDADGKPVYSGIANAHVASVASFAEWYRDTTGVNHPTASKMTLWNDGKGNYVNRYGANGEQWNITNIAYYCGNVGREKTDAAGNPIPCTSIDPNPTQCDTMIAAGGHCSPAPRATVPTRATIIISKVDGNPLFFPVDGRYFHSRLGFNLQPFHPTTMLRHLAL